jgi:hypothetical protein
VSSSRPAAQHLPGAIGTETRCISSALGVDADYRNVAGGDGVETIGFAIRSCRRSLLEQVFGEAS